MKKAILVISFGTSYPETRRKNIEACEKKLAAHWPDRDFFRAFTSYMIIDKLAKRDGEQIDNPEQALVRLHQQGYRDVIIQSLHVINGDEFEKITRQIELFSHHFERLVIGNPLITHFNDYEKIVTALQQQMPLLNDHERVVFMGHGAQHYAFAAYACLDHLFQTKALPVIVGAVESYPGIETIIPRLQREGVTKVHLMPLMIVAGDHALNDMASDRPESWRSLIEQAGIEVECHLRGLGENPLIQALFVEHLQTAIKKQEERS